MNEAAWRIVQSAADAAARHFSKAAALHDKGAGAGVSDEAYYREMAFMHAMQSGQNSVEAAIMRIFGLYDEAVPTGPNWHADLIRMAGEATSFRPAIVPPQTALLLHETRRFRNVAVHSYEDFDIAKAGPAVAAARALSASLARIFEDFRTAVGESRGAL